MFVSLNWHSINRSNLIRVVQFTRIVSLSRIIFTISFFVLAKQRNNCQSRLHVITLSLRIQFLFRKIFTRHNVFGQCPTHVWNRLNAYPNSILDHPPPPSAFSIEQSHSEIIRRIQRECQHVLFFSPYRFVLQFLNLRDTLTAVNRSFCKTRL